MANGTPYVVEFLFRGRDPTDEAAQPATYHVILGRWVDTIDNGRKLETGRTLRPAQATAAGFPLTALTGAIAAQAMIDKDLADAASAAATTAKNTAQAERSAAQGERDAANTARDAANAARDVALARVAELEAQLAQSSAAVQQQTQLAMNLSKLVPAASAKKTAAKEG